MAKRIRKAVFPVAGLGTRFLPATKANPKEMLPVVDKPLIQYAAEEAVKAGIETLIFVNGRNKRSIPDHFDKAYELETELEEQGKMERLEAVRNIVPSHVACIYIRQSEALGLGHAVMCAEPAVGDEPFAVILADDLIDDGDGDGCLAQMVARYDEQVASILGVQRVPHDQVDRYGVVDVEPVAERLGQLKGIVEKPDPADAPSDLGVVGRYILNSSIFNKLRQTRPGSGGEIQLTDALDALRQDEPVLAYEFIGTRYDCGDKLGYLQATVEYGLKHPELGPAFAEYLAQRG
ncbi:UTP-glucose-1-phosphate uridylyltransferase [Spiribacter salinus M19-40]|uniref:UTP--glucose-1-phosphate uridylyltransferase n=2 Tax=Spiribacter salinus TaxID=1335746 RepID=R4VJT3_9GAMM|nr:UTP--glucose-1-phosphate uridylyltransferase GalU [Spiribacter salinus]AGM40777.1 UTP-glucose-1-phosphate uridylyltransferase [Spiribacter salinus M19-40]TQE98627.1 MAG: UTP--glucose-1-phosphate uridylyltransferase GalU [Spiribacter salinus]